ncbi:CDP-glycerol glycerophosphotransferase family protein [Ligilactobacillus agilis]|uniref:CDP-glycerol glycerophosphotransferase family protein n=1 Tax=Ligilactobacillus agilis TaxID=1601 RepID=UPI001438196B|nr:CDP-glycerol glycerophosphotransferase family protein [Ligilactobacillus agilis]GET16102.1 hypothetical protein NB11A_03930 [Ligilactobacillus agilis]
MNASDRKEILSVITTLVEANDYLAASDEISLEQLDRVVKTCLTASDGIGQTLETFGEYADYQANLTAYQQLLADFLVAIEQAGELTYPASAVRDCLAQLISKLSAPHKKQVVFLPYKASMWDSLASIYEATLADPTCEPYVIPIPYFTKDAHGKLKDFHYEGDLFPKEVKITSWKDYPLAKKRPEVIYIHNPYDDGNQVTTVLPAFYSAKLKQYTDLLVYVPYFVGLHERGFFEHILSVDLQHVDLVCVQDEVVKVAYQKELRKYARETQAYPKKQVEQFLDKLVALGNPKYDALNKVTPANYPLPSDWHKKIYRPDGSKKTVVFYNNTLLEVGAYGRAILEKYTDVFNFFWANRDDYVIIWRPHPLLADTIRIKYPEYFPGYLQLVEQFKDSQIGIYDDRPDFHLAYTYADAFYGDLSSMAELFRKLNRPVIQQLVTYETAAPSAQIDFKAVKDHLSKQEVLREHELPLAQLPTFLASIDNNQTRTNYHFGLDIHRYVMNLVD